MMLHFATLFFYYCYDMMLILVLFHYILMKARYNFFFYDIVTWRNKRKSEGNIKVFFFFLNKRKGQPHNFFSLSKITFQPFSIDGIHQVPAIHLS